MTFDKLKAVADRLIKSGSLWALLTAVGAALGMFGWHWSARVSAVIAMVSTALSTLSAPLHSVWDDVKAAWEGK